MPSNEVLLAIGATVVALAMLRFGFLMILCGGDTVRLSLSRRAAGKILKDAAFADKVKELLDAEAPKKEEPKKPSAEPLWLLTVLQREGRLLDFLLEDIQAYANEQIGAAVRDIHRNCQKALKEHVTLTPVLPQSEGDAVNVPAGFDPSAIQVTGNVTGEPPYKGTLQHHGWRAANIQLTPPPKGQDQFVLQPAEVEVS